MQLLRAYSRVAIISPVNATILRITFADSRTVLHHLNRASSKKVNWQWTYGGAVPRWICCGRPLLQQENKRVRRKRRKKKKKYKKVRREERQKIGTGDKIRGFPAAWIRKMLVYYRVAEKARKANERGTSFCRRRAKSDLGRRKSAQDRSFRILHHVQKFVSCYVSTNTQDVHLLWGESRRSNETRFHAANGQRSLEILSQAVFHRFLISTFSCGKYMFTLQFFSKGLIKKKQLNKLYNNQLIIIIIIIINTTPVKIF